MLSTAKLWAYQLRMNISAIDFAGRYSLLNNKVIYRT